MTVLPTRADDRKDVPLAQGLLYYFPAALAEVARVSKKGNDQHHEGDPLHWDRGKSSDHADALMRHLMEAGTRDEDGTRHSAKVAWRALALLQVELEAAGAPVARNAREAAAPQPQAQQTSYPWPSSAVDMKGKRNNTYRYDEL